MRIEPVFRTRLFPACLVLLMIMAGGCSIQSRMMANLSDTIVNNNDLAMVEAGAPAYLLMIDGLIKDDPNSEEMLSTAALLYTSYADVFVRDGQRAGKIAAKALGYANRALCISNTEACGLKEKPYEEFTAALESTDRGDIRALFSLGSAWAGWIMANKEDFNALADISRIEDIMLQVVRLDESYRDGAPFLYLGSLATFLPPALGGRPGQGKTYFEKAIELSKGKNLMAKVMFAKLYARMLFDRELHDRLLQEVMETDPAVPGHTLVNTYAQEQARRLLEEADDYF
ncbi:TRAP transporter TatT component family protein [Desulfospira joergensenii]|uniref:TRAP transporter TatT component family protein n=1 Tax=Desulfospira joergensenii TaxID=53329 RepID=UPI00068611C8|nr:TRAP transporter TatT component family protein [Desulfospira joergensenii]